MKITNHANIRMKERVKLNRKERKEMFRLALRLGQAPYNIKNNPELRQYLYSKENRRMRVKLYKDYIFVYTKRSKRLVTMYELSSKFLEEK